MSYLFLVSLHVVGIESEYFVYTRYHIYVCEMNLVCAYHTVVYPIYLFVRLNIYYVELPVILYLLCNVWYITRCPNEKKLCM